MPKLQRSKDDGRQPQIERWTWLRRIHFLLTMDVPPRHGRGSSAHGALQAVVAGQLRFEHRSEYSEHHLFFVFSTPSGSKKLQWRKGFVQVLSTCCESGKLLRFCSAKNRPKGQTDGQCFWPQNWNEKHHIIAATSDPIEHKKRLGWAADAAFEGGFCYIF